MRFALVYGDPVAGRAPAEPHGWGSALGAVIVANLLLGVVIAGALLIVGRATGYDFSELLGGAGPWLGLTQLIAISIAYALLGWFVVGTSGRSLRDLGFGRQALIGALPWALAGLAAAAPALAQILTLPAGWEMAAASALPIIAPLILVQSGVEEILFRGVLLGALAARYGALPGVLISALLFGIWHIDPTQAWQDVALAVGSTFVFGVTSALLALKQGHLGGAIALHAVWNITRELQVGLQNWPEPFWGTYSFGETAPVQTWDAATLSATLLPLLIETVIVLTATRFVLGAVIKDRGLQPQSGGAYT